MNRKIVICDDNDLIRESLAELLVREGYEVRTAGNGRAGWEAISNDPPPVALVDLKMSELDGLGLLARIKEHFPWVDVILITGFGSVETAVEAMKKGATDYLTKPIHDDEIKKKIRALFHQKELEEENTLLKKRLCPRNEVFSRIVGEHPKMQAIFSMIQSIADTHVTVLIEGESGTGKGLIARSIHEITTTGKDKPFVELSCGALPPNLLESELFGHVKGSFTSAHKDRAGRFELANEGAIFLDEIDTLPPALQVKLLRVLQHKEFERVGDTKTTKVDVRIIAATNQSLEDAIRTGNFREDLFYRLNVIKIQIPPLRERRTDIPLLVDHFIRVFNERFKRQVRSLSDEMLAAFLEYPFPGNVREVENLLERAIVLSKGPILEAADFPEGFLEKVKALSSLPTHLHREEIPRLKEALKNPEKQIIEETLRKTRGKRQEAARLLGINRTTLYHKMKQHQIV